MHLVRVIAPKVRTAAPGDILMTPFANHSTFPFAISLVPPADITMGPAFRNVSTFPSKRITTGTEPNITISELINVSTFPTIEVDAAPADAFIRMGAVFENDSSFPTIEVDAAPDDVFLRMSIFANTTTFGSIVVDTGEVISVDDYGPLGMDPLGSTPAF